VRRNIDQLRADGAYIVRSGQGVKLAHAPELRAVGVGPGPGHAAVVEIVAFVAAMKQSERAAAWEARYTGVALEELPWYTEGVDDDVEAALHALALPSAAAGRRLLEVGSGPGSSAIAFARRGFRVTATDLAPSAIALARAREGAGAVDWRVDDVTRTRLRDAFDLVIDRGCLHVLDADGAVGWSSAMAKLARPGGHLVVKCFSGEVRPPSTSAYSADTLATLLGPAFRLERAQPGGFTPRTGGPRQPACVATFRRA
jgi:SAM-dependent methyltransferase